MPLLCICEERCFRIVLDGPVNAEKLEEDFTALQKRQPMLAHTHASIFGRCCSSNEDIVISIASRHKALRLALRISITVADMTLRKSVHVITPPCSFDLILVSYLIPTPIIDTPRKVLYMLQ